MPTLAEQVAALEAERDALAKREIGVDPMFKQAYEHEKGLREYWERRFEEEKQSRLATESRLASARVEGAREAADALIKRMKNGCNDYQFAKPNELWHWRAVEMWADRAFREYPAPAAPAGEQTRREHCGCWADRAPSEPCVCPAPTLEPERRYVLAAIAREFDEDGAPISPILGYARLNVIHAEQLVALGSRPTQTAEG